MPSQRRQTWISAIGIAAAVLCTAAVAVYSYVTALSTPLHSTPQAVPSSLAAPPSPEWADAVELGRQAAREGLVEKNLPGLSVAVGAAGEVVWAEAFGWADIEKRLPVTPQLRFRIGHVSKALTSAGVGVLVERDLVDLDTEIQTYVPAFPKKEWPITLRQLMGHMAGIRHYDSEEDYMPTAHCDRASEGLQRFAESPLLFEPETQSRYSTYGWILASAAVEAAAGEPFFAFMRREVFEPLGMASTVADSPDDSTPDVVTFYYPRFSGDPSSGSDPARRVDYSCFAGAGAFLSTPTDLVKFGNGLGARKLLKRSTVAMLQTPQVLASGQETEHGLGWQMQSVPVGGEPTSVAGHASLTLLGGSTSFLTFPDLGIVVAVTSNTSRANTRSIALRIAEAFAGR
jgi:serine beta-lactamase-like protein LACTB, mitochondrial